MTTYKELFGKYVQNYASDPTSTDAEGQIWYNSTSGTFKTALGGVGAWSSGGSLNTARSALAGAGTQTAGLAFGGRTSPPTNSTATELYNGTSWTSNPTGLSAARNGATGAGGSLSSGWLCGGNPSPAVATEEWTGPGTPVTKTITTS